MNILRDGKVRKIKAGVTEADLRAKGYFEKHPGAKVLDFEPEYPDMEQLSEWVSDSVCEAVDGCTVEPDGTCEHGFPSWLLQLGMI